MDIDSRRLRFFVEVVRQGGFSQAAKVVFASQPAVSKAVQQLEAELGVPLLNRAGGRSELTDAGRIVYRHAVAALAEGTNLLAELDELRGLKRGTLRLGFPRVGTSAMFAPIYALFRRRHPEVDVVLTVHDSNRLEETLRSGELDLAAFTAPVPEGLDSLEALSEPLVVIMSRDHPLASRRALRIESLAQMPLILFEEGFPLNDRILDAFHEKGIKPNVVAHSGQVDFIFELVAVGFGIAFLPRVLAERRPHRLVRCPLLRAPKCRWRIAFAWRRGQHLSHAARAWLAVTRACHGNARARRAR
jgi:DNA-binding transcriptional LysR family regulator